MPPLPPWTKRDNFRVPPHQRVVDHVNALSLLTGAGDLDTVATPGGRTVVDRRPVAVAEIVFGKVTDAGPAGEGDFDDGRYWVVKQRPEVPAADTDATTLVDDESPEGDMVSDDGTPVAETVVFATNANPDDTEHSLEVDTPVVLIAFYATDDTGARVKRYMMLPMPPTAGSGQTYSNQSTLVQSESPGIELDATLTDLLTFQVPPPNMGGSGLGVALHMAVGADYTVLQSAGGRAVFESVRFMA